MCVITEAKKLGIFADIMDKAHPVVVNRRAVLTSTLFVGKTVCPQKFPEVGISPGFLPEVGISPNIVTLLPNCQHPSRPC